MIQITKVETIALLILLAVGTLSSSLVFSASTFDCQNDGISTGIYAICCNHKPFGYQWVVGANGCGGSSRVDKKCNKDGHISGEEDDITPTIFCAESQRGSTPFFQ